MEKRIYEWVAETVSICAKSETVAPEELAGLFKKQEQEYETFSEQWKTAAKEVLLAQFESADLVYVCSFLVQYMDQNTWGDLLFRGLMGMDMEPDLAIMLKLQLNATIKGFHGEQNQYNKKVVSLLAEHLQLPYSYIPIKNRNPKRVVFITEQMLSMKHAPTKLVFDYAYVLKTMFDCEVMIFSCVSNSPVVADAWHNGTIMNADDRFLNVKWSREYRGERFEGYQICLNEDYLKQYGMMMDIIYHWNPLFVFSLGASNPVAEVPNLFTDVVYRQMAVGMPVADSRFVTVPGCESNRAYRDEDGRSIIELGGIRTVFLPAKHNYTREELGLPEDKFLVTIVGNRLDEEVSDAFLQALRSVYERNSNVEFVVIGEIAELGNKLADEPYVVHCLGYCDDLMGVMPTMDLYLNPVRRGGGFSGGIALYAGVPVVTLPDCDVAYHAGEKFIVHDMDDMVETVIRYAEDPGFYKRQEIKTKLFAKEHTEENYYKDLAAQLQMIEDALNTGNGE